MISERVIWRHGSRFVVRTVSLERVRLPYDDATKKWKRPETLAAPQVVKWACARHHIVVFCNGRYAFANVPRKSIRRWIEHFALEELKK